MEIRDAVPGDADAACLVLRRSIAELCLADHGDDLTVLARWLENKTPEIVAGWIGQPGNHMLLAVEAGTVLAVGSVTEEGQVTLNYVSPDARFRGVSTALLAALEARAAACGRGAVHLTSTETARAFYLARGYEQIGPAERRFGTNGYPMRKSLKS